MSLDKLESTNRLLHDLERKLSITSSSSSTHTNQSHTSHGSVVQDPAYVGVARQNIQSSVLNYIKNNGSNFDADRVYANRQQKFSATSFGREYSPGSSASPPAFEVTLDENHDPHVDSRDAAYTKDGQGKVKKSNGSDPLVPNRPEVSSNRSEKTANTVDRGFLDSLNLDQDVAPLSPSPRASPKESPGRTQACMVSPEKKASELVYGGDDDYNLDHYDDYYDSDSFTQDLSNADLEASPTNENSSDEDLGLEPELLLPPSPPRMPPRELDPDKLYGIYDFSGPDPSHCTLSRDEPVYLRNDSDNYWWLIQKLSKSERLSLWNARGSEEDLFDDDEHGKIGFVPAECLETYEERLARLNCFRNENLDKELELETTGVQSKEVVAPSEEVTSPSDTKPVLFGRTGSILKKSGAFKLSNKSVTFENLEDSRGLEDDEMEFSDDDEVDFSDHYYSMSHEDMTPGASLAAHEADEKHSEVLSDVFPSEIPLQINKKSRKKSTAKEHELFGFDQPNMHIKEDQASIGSFSPDTPQQEPSKQFNDDGGQVRRSLIIDRLHLVTSDLTDTSRDVTFGGVLHAEDLGSDGDPEGMIPDTQSFKTQSMEEVSTPRTSISNHSDIKISESESDITNAISPRDKKRTKPMHDMFTPLLGKLDELTEKLAEFEQSL